MDRPAERSIPSALGLSNPSMQPTHGGRIPVGQLNVGQGAPASAYTGNSGDFNANSTPPNAEDVTRAPPTVALAPNRPGTGGGSLRPISQSFKVNAVNGTMSLGLPLNTTPSRSKLSPTLELQYDSGSGNGPFGIGWQLDTSSISRKLSKRLPLYDDTDVFLISGAEDLVPTSGQGRGLLTSSGSRKYYVLRYRPRVDNPNTRIERWTAEDDSSEVFWRTISSDNITTLYGRSDDSRIFDVDDSGSKRIFSWLISYKFNAYGEGMTFTYKAEDSTGLENPTVGSGYQWSEANRSDSIRARNRYLKSIKYGNRHPNRDLDTWAFLPDTEDFMFEVVMDYGEHGVLAPTTAEERSWDLRKDPFSVYNCSFELRSYRLCRRVLMFHHLLEKLKRKDYLVSSTEFKYDEAEAGSFLVSYQVFGHVADESGGYQTEAQPPYEFQYTRNPRPEELQIKTADFPWLRGSPGLSLPTCEWVDLDGEGMPGLLFELPDGSWAYQRNESALDEEGGLPKFSPWQILQSHPSRTAFSEHYFEDLDGSGKLNLVYTNPEGLIDGYHGRLDGDWSEYATFSSIPNLKLSDPSVKRIDLTGNGLLDLLLEDPRTNQLIWHRCLAKAGFGPEQRTRRNRDGPRLLDCDKTFATYLADMSGDGLTDLVRITNGAVIYWPNLGNGRFGAKVIMEKAPILDAQDQLNLQRLRLADIDGSGTTDIVYLPKTGGANVFYNQAGNSWSDVSVIYCCPRIDNLSSVFVTDLLGRGTSCLCWTGPAGNSSAPNVLKFIDLTTGIKPHLLQSYSNGLGASVTVKYRPSTWYFLKDERSGTPWKTKLPFPVHCVREIKLSDDIASSARTTKYAYHDGYYDGTEREFRGFAMVEKWDSEEFKLGGGIQYKTPSSYTKSFFHTGSALVSSYLADSRELSPPSLPSDLAPGESYEVHRALKGQILRLELYGDDSSAKSKLPYKTVESNYSIFRIQVPESGVPGIYRVAPSDTLTKNVERETSEPRREHQIVLQVNDFGDAVKSASIFYGKTDSSLDTATDRSAQEDTVFEYSTTEYTNVIDQGDTFRKPAVASKKRYRILGVQKNALFQSEDLRRDDFAFFECPDQSQSKEIDPEDTTKRKVLLDETRTYYLSEDFSHRKDLGFIDIMSVADQSFRLALEPDLKKALFSANGNLGRTQIDDILNAGGYVTLPDREGHWWQSSTVYRFSKDPADQLKSARKSFYIPTVTIDPLKKVYSVEMDDVYLKPETSTDPLGSVTTATIDYVRLQLVELLDANRNRTKIALDAFGQAVGVAKMGKDGEQLGDSLNGFNAILSETALNEFMKTPTSSAVQTLLGEAQSRTIYGRLTYYKTKKDPKIVPTFEATLTRAQHFQQDGGKSKVSISIVYYDGRGHPIQKANLLSNDGVTVQWRINGWQVIKSGGNPVRQFQPSFSPLHEFTPYVNIDSPSKTIFYDACDRTIGVLNPDHTWSKDVFGPWDQTSYDAGDTVSPDDPSQDPDLGSYFQKLDKKSYLPTWQSINTSSDPKLKWQNDAATKSSAYHNTPSKAHFNAQGKPILKIFDNGHETYSNRIEYDVSGNVAGQYDNMGRLIIKVKRDLLGTETHQVGMDTGETWKLVDCLQRQIFVYNGRGIGIRNTYDPLGRPAEIWVGKATQPEVIVTKFRYGEGEQDDIAKNLRGQLTRVCDQSGTKSNDKFDFKGNCLSSSVQYALNYKDVLDWNSATVALEQDVYKMSSEYDAFDRAILETDAHGAMTQRDFDYIGRLSSVSWRLSTEAVWQTYVSQISYTADDLTSRIDYGNGSHVQYIYHEAARTVSQKKTWRDSGAVLENFTYNYDCLGRQTHVINDAQEDIFFRNSKIEPSQDYTYDCIGQLIKATGREQINTKNGGVKSFAPPTSGPIVSTRIPGDGSQLADYTEMYEYDTCGNITLMKHEAANDTSISSWTRRYFYEEQSMLSSAVKGDRLSRTEIGSASEQYSYAGEGGSRGCMTSLPGFSSLNWDYFDRLQSSSSQKFNEGTPETTWYVYDSAGIRVRKVTERPSAKDVPPKKLKETRYLGHSEIYRQYSGIGETIQLEKRFSGVIGSTRIATVELDGPKGSKQPLIRYQPSNGLELDDSSQVVSYEEYTPFGSSTYSACRSDIDAPSRYRYSAYERDNETGLYYCSARYYAPWIGRWISADPLGPIDGLNVYTYCSNDPVDFVDPDGTMHQPADPPEILATSPRRRNNANPRQSAYEFPGSVNVSNSTGNDFSRSGSANQLGRRQIAQGNDEISQSNQGGASNHIVIDIDALEELADEIPVSNVRGGNRRDLPRQNASISDPPAQVERPELSIHMSDEEDDSVQQRQVSSRNSGSQGSRNQVIEVPQDVQHILQMMQEDREFYRQQIGDLQGKMNTMLEMQNASERDRKKAKASWTKKLRMWYQKKPKTFLGKVGKWVGAPVALALTLWGVTADTIQIGSQFAWFD